MKKHLLTVILSSSLMVGGAAAAFPTEIHAQSDQTARIVKSVTFRDEPNTGGDKIRFLKTGETVSILDKVNAYWYKIKDSRGMIGFVTTSDEYLDANWREPQQLNTGANASIVRSVSFRTTPSTNGDMIRYLKTGEQVTVLEKTNAYWYKVRDENGTIGYVSSNSKYISTNYQEPVKPEIPKSEAVQKVIAAGMKYIGTPYEFGSSRSNTNTFDCSDFVRQAYLDGIGLKLPADSRSQGDYIKRKGNIKTDWRQLQPGDIMFFMSYKGSKASAYEGVDKLSERITHNGIYIGDGKILQTYSKESGGVRIDSIEGTQWEKRFLFGGSPM